MKILMCFYMVLRSRNDSNAEHEILTKSNFFVEELSVHFSSILLNYFCHQPLRLQQCKEIIEFPKLFHLNQFATPSPVQIFPRLILLSIIVGV